MAHEIETTNDLVTGLDVVVRVRGELTFANREHGPRDAALLALADELTDAYGAGEFQADVRDDLLSATWSFVPVGA